MPPHRPLQHPRRPHCRRRQLLVDDGERAAGEVELVLEAKTLQGLEDVGTPVLAFLGKGLSDGGSMEASGIDGRRPPVRAAMSNGYL